MVRKDIVSVKDLKDIDKSIDEEIRKDYYEKVKKTLISKRKQIRMIEITLEKAKKEYDDILTGKKVVDEEAYLFENDRF